MARAASARRPVRDDIPVARRSTPAPRRSGSGFGLFLACVVVCGGSVGAVLFGPQLLARLNPPEPEGIEGFQERPDADGRLLGHFPYSEATEPSLIVVEPGIELHADAADAFEAMRQAAASDGVDLRLLSGYRSINLQEEIFFEVASERNQTAEERARVSAPPGYSEHRRAMPLISVMERPLKPISPRISSEPRLSAGCRITPPAITSSCRSRSEIPRG